jgi:hypothetical protein
MDLPTELSWNLFIDWWFLILFGSYMVVGYFINREANTEFTSVNNNYERLENPTEFEIGRRVQSLIQIQTKRRYQYIQFWLVCITVTTTGILVTLLKQ